MKTLLDVNKREKFRITEILGGKGLRQNLSHLGIGEGSVLTVVRNAPFSGPLLLEYNGTNITIGKGIAAKIKVETII